MGGTVTKDELEATQLDYAGASSHGRLNGILEPPKPKKRRSDAGIPRKPKGPDGSAEQRAKAHLELVQRVFEKREELAAVQEQLARMEEELNQSAYALTRGA